MAVYCKDCKHCVIEKDYCQNFKPGNPTIYYWCEAVPDYVRGGISRESCDRVNPTGKCERFEAGEPKTIKTKSWIPD